MLLVGTSVAIALRREKKKGADSWQVEATHSSSALFSVPGSSTCLMLMPMATGIMYRRLAGRPYRTAGFSTVTKILEQKMLFGKVEGSRGTSKAGRGAKVAVTFRVWLPPEHGVLLNPSAHRMAKRLHHEGASRGLWETLPEGDSAPVSPKQVPCTDSVTRAKRPSNEEGVLQDEEVLLSRRPLQHATLKDDGHDDDDDEVELYNMKEYTRMFLKQRPEYRPLCYNEEEFSQPLPTEEGERILQKVSIMKSSLKPETIAEYFFKLSCLPSEQHRAFLSQFSFNVLCQCGVKNLGAFATADLITVLKAFATFGILPSHPMLKSYEKEFCRRVWDMSLDELLLVGDLWRYLGRSVPWYLEIMLSYVNLRWKELTLPQLVQLVYLIGEGRKAPEELMQKLDVLVSTHLESLSPEEVGIVCLGFFKSKHYLSEPTMKRVGLKVCAHVADISNYALVNVLKMYRFTYSGHMDFMKKLGKVVPSRVETMSIQSIMHIMLACSALHYLDEKLMNYVAASVPSKIAYCRCKDVAKLLWSFGTLNYEPPNAEEFYSSLEEQLHVKFHEFQQYAEHLITALLALALAKRFHYDLIDYALSPKFISLCRKGRYSPDRDLLTLDGTVEVECPDYTGHRLTPEFREEVVNKVRSSARQNVYEKPEFTAALSILEDMLGGPRFVKKHLILPHNRTVDIEIHLDSNQKPLPFNSEALLTAPLTLKGNGVSLTDDLMNRLLKGKANGQSLGADKGIEWTQNRAGQQNSPSPTGSHPLFSDAVPLTDSLLNSLTKTKASPEAPNPQPTGQPPGGMKLAVQVSSRNHFCFGSRHMLGLHQMKRRQLRKIGYVVIEIPPWEWTPLLHHSYSKKWSYLHGKVFRSLDERKPKCPAESEF